MGIYIFNWDILKKYLTEDEADPNSENDFGKNVIPNLLKDGRRMYAYHFERLLEGRRHHFQPVAGQHGGPGSQALRHQPV